MWVMNQYTVLENSLPWKSSITKAFFTKMLASKNVLTKTLDKYFASVTVTIGGCMHPCSEIQSNREVGCNTRKFTVLKSYHSEMINLGPLPLLRICMHDHKPQMKVCFIISFLLEFMAALFVDLYCPARNY